MKMMIDEGHLPTRKTFESGVRGMTDIRRYRAWVRAMTKLSTATSLMIDVVIIGVDPNIQAECREIWNRMDEIKSEMERKIEQMEVEE